MAHLFIKEHFCWFQYKVYPYKIIFLQTTAELEIHPNGKWMYVSNRGTGALIAFEVLDDGQLLFLQVERDSLIS